MIPLFGIGLQGKSPTVTASHRLNLYYEFQQEQDKTRVAVYGTPGLEIFPDFGDTPIRGLYEKGTLFYVVHRGTFWEVNNAGTKTSRGTLNTTTGHVCMSDNNTQIMIDDGTDGYIYTISTTTLAVISDGDFPTTPSSSTYLDTYFIVTVQFNLDNQNSSIQFNDITATVGDVNQSYELVNGFSLGNGDADIYAHSNIQIKAVIIREGLDSAGTITSIKAYLNTLYSVY